MKAADLELRIRCDALLVHATTDEEWYDARLIEMDGADATDEQLVAYWRLYRHLIATYEIDLAPDLAEVVRPLEAGLDPVAEWDARWASNDLDDDDDEGWDETP